MRVRPGLVVARVQRPDEQADCGLEVQVRPELPVARSLGKHLQQSFSRRLADPLPEAFEEFGVTALLGQKSPQDSLPVLPGQVDLQILEGGQSVCARITRRERNRLGPQSADPDRARSSLPRNLRRTLGGVVPAAAPLTTCRRNRARPARGPLRGGWRYREPRRGAAPLAAPCDGRSRVGCRSGRGARSRPVTARTLSRICGAVPSGHRRPLRELHITIIGRPYLSQ